ncbi:transcriptional regulator [Sphaerisporangium rufum]|uniref:Transcriptional regulator n=1 Tax=Sphaerisporangium rufum TaxID=1381558 RepID=A0A919R9W2_9ACTN|nr:TetR-like C-terminal domain-containing protein [Sphaerisporangium rufum]GII81878.1 transcriptional regulator [Sphaerisporangium rufum]
MTPRAGLTADRVTRAAADLADRIGFAALTVSGLARELGVRDASLYSHIRNLADLRARVAVLATAEMADQIGAAVAGRAGKEALAAFAHAYRRFAVRHPGRYAATQIALDPEVVAASPGHRRTLELTGGMIRAYRLAERDQVDAVRLLRSTFHGFSHFEATGGFLHGRDVDASFARAIDALHVALENWPSHDKEGTP